MIGYAATDVFSALELAVFEAATQVVAKLPERAGGDLVRCHEVARVVAAWIEERHLRPRGTCCYCDGQGALHRDTANPVPCPKCEVPRLGVVDGKYSLVEHSWILLRTPTVGLPRMAILDPYCVGRLPMVQLIDAWLPDHRALYRQGATRTDIRSNAIVEMVTALEKEFLGDGQDLDSV